MNAYTRGWPLGTEALHFGTSPAATVATFKQDYL